MSDEPIKSNLIKHYIINRDVAKGVFLNLKQNLHAGDILYHYEDNPYHAKLSLSLVPGKGPAIELPKRYFNERD